MSSADVLEPATPPTLLWGARFLLRSRADTFWEQDACPQTSSTAPRSCVDGEYQVPVRAAARYKRPGDQSLATHGSVSQVHRSIICSYFTIQEFDMQASAPVDTHNVISKARAQPESGQDRSSTILIVTPKKEFRIPRNAAERRSRDRARNHAAHLRRLQWSVEETYKFASAEVVLSKI
jgi:hypothetical protein